MRRRVGTGLAAAIGLAVLWAGLGSGSAGAVGKEKLVEGTAYDTTCATACVPECPPPPHCGPITAGRASAAIVCAQQQQRIIVCPLQTTAEGSPPICLPESGCVSYPVYWGEGAIVNVRKRGSATVLATLPIVEGHFKLRLGPGEYVFHPYLPEESCWFGTLATVKVTVRLKSPVPVTLDVSNHCVARPDAAS